MATHNLQGNLGQIATHAFRMLDYPNRNTTNRGGDGDEDQRTLAGTGDAGEDRQPALRDLDTHVPQVVLPGALHPDDIVTVGGLHHDFPVLTDAIDRGCGQALGWLNRMRLP